MMVVDANHAATDVTFLDHGILFQAGVGTVASAIVAGTGISSDA